MQVSDAWYVNASDIVTAVFMDLMPVSNIRHGIADGIFMVAITDVCVDVMYLLDRVLDPRLSDGQLLGHGLDRGRADG